ncbi:polysaccharide deacetylase family protein [Amycolatopsis cynarae]|uniref:Polysaccharide deacetylase family protein n=1 Tax=Amycolatopsis cynarae TaxID=2995223 RepID=A0ABY7AZ87_9PSEU|nr:polysaccharide deacetylase family protein [Amycolatopsis sp. HUAS 11-8]WAL65340.1 polysaccharide deacetylase family protein [Amycolatopsis sp. HUAS 11-8]
MKLRLPGLLLAVIVLVGGCSAGQPKAAAPPQTSPPPVSPVAASTPYPFGEVQQKAGPIVDGKVPLVRHITVDRPYVFLTIDDGAIANPDAPQLIRESGAHPVLFLNERYVKGREAYFRQLLDAGATLGDHTIDHPNLRGKPLAFQQNEICGDADELQRSLGVRPVLFRPPFGSYDTNTLLAAANCGMRVSVLWTASVNDGRVDFQKGNRLQAGDIVLMHFRKTFVEDYTAFVNQAKKDGLTPVPLPDFLG